MHFHLTKILLIIVFLIGAGEKALLAQETKAKKNVCIEELFILYEKYFYEYLNDKKYLKAKAFLERLDREGKDSCPMEDDATTLSIREFVRNYEFYEFRTKCQAADNAYFTNPNPANLQLLMKTCDQWIAMSPTPDQFFSARLGVATGFGLLASFYTDTDQTFSYAEKALERLADESAPQDWKTANWIQFRRAYLGRMFQYQGLCKLRQSKPDAEAAVLFLTKAAEIQAGDSHLDVNTYLLRIEAYKMSCLVSKESLGACSASSNIIADYARIIAISVDKPEFKSIHDRNYEEAKVFWNLFHPDNTLEKFDDLINIYKAEFRKK